jgi:hypothetical protein
MGLIIFIVLMLTIINIFTTKELTNMLSETIFDNTTFYRICLIPPIGAIIYCICLILIIILFLY